MQTLRLAIKNELMQNLMWWENPMTNKNSKTKTAAKEMQRIRIKRNQRAQKQDGCEEETITEHLRQV